MLRFLVLSILLISFGCRSGKVNSSTEIPIIMMEKTACMGECPAFKFEVFLDKSAHYTGKSNVKNVGEFTATLTDQQLDYLENSFAEADYFSFANVYSASVTDLPTTYIYYNNGKENLKITDYYGAPEKLKTLEKQIQDFIDTIDWEKSN